MAEHSKGDNTFKNVILSFLHTLRYLYIPVSILLANCKLLPFPSQEFSSSGDIEDERLSHLPASPLSRSANWEFWFRFDFFEQNLNLNLRKIWIWASMAYPLPPELGRSVNHEKPIKFSTLHLNNFSKLL